MRKKWQLVRKKIGNRKEERVRNNVIRERRITRQVKRLEGMCNQTQKQTTNIGG